LKGNFQFLIVVLSDYSESINDENLIENIDAEGETDDPDAAENRSDDFHWKFHDLHAQVTMFTLEYSTDS
jgi:hypothetical protein